MWVYVYVCVCMCVCVCVCVCMCMCGCACSGYVRKYFDVKKRAFLRNFMRDFGRLYALFLFVNHTKNNRCEIRAFVLTFMRVFSI